MTTPVAPPRDARESQPAAPLDAERGYRYLRRQLPDSREEWTARPLTDDDILNPEEGDVMSASSVHDLVNDALADMLRERYMDNRAFSVFHDVKMLWGLPGLDNPAPDIAVTPAVREPERNRSSFDVLAEGTRPALIIEVVSPRTAELDTGKKVSVYARAGVREYVILDPAGCTDAPVRGYRLVRGAYRPMAVDEDGLVECATVGVLLGLEGSRVVALDAATGARLLTHEETAQARRAAEARAETAEARAERLAAQLRAAGIEPEA